MIDRELIEKIVREVIAKQIPEENDLLEKKKPNLLVVGDISFVRPEQLSKIQAKWSIRSYEGEGKVRLDDIDHVLFMYKTQDLLVKGALGIFDTPDSKLLSRCLMESTPATIVPTIYLADHLFSKSPINRAYVSQLRKYAEILLQFGTRVDTFERFIEMNCGTNNVKQKEETTSNQKKILTQRDIQNCKGKYLEVDTNTIITPLAKDTAREMGIDIKELDSKGAKDKWN